MNKLFNKIDNSQLVLLRIFYGLILFFECAGAIATGWVNEVFDVPEFTFNFIGFDFLQAPNLLSINVTYGIMALLGLMIAFGYRYRFSTILLALLWTATYLMHKVHYNNHHYLMFLLNWIMVFVPAQNFKSIDVRQKRVKQTNWCYQWHVWIFIGLLWIAYTYAAVAKMNPDWVRAIPLKSWLASKVNRPFVGPIYEHEALAYAMAWGGLVFDLLVVPLLLWKPTRKVTFVISIIFHLSNSITFQIGTFPYTMIGASVLFFPIKTIQKRFFKRKEFFETVPQGGKPLLSRQKRVAAVFSIFMLVQILLPLRHYTIKGNVFWTEEGHRLSWRMMLRAKQGSIKFTVTKDGKKIPCDPEKDLSRRQYFMLRVKPDVIWQYVQFLKEKHGDDIKVYVDSWVQLNNRTYYQFIKPGVNMAEAKWNYFGHADWITDFQGWDSE